MGVYDSVWVKCPSCNHRIEKQSKGGYCILRNYELDEAPEDVLSDIEQEFSCPSCGRRIQLKIITKTITLKIPIVV